MPKPEKVRNPNAIPSGGAHGSGTTSVDGDTVSVPSLSSLPSDTGRVIAASIAFAALLSRTDGWLRCIPAGDGKVNYFKWKFNTGPHSNKYVMYVGDMNDWAGSILGLHDKLDEVDRGVRKPAHDTFYDPR